MSASLAMIPARTPVSSLTSRRAVCSGFSPLSIAPFGRAIIAVGAFGRAFVGLVDFFGRSMCGSMTARNQRPRIFRSTTPPAENSRTMVGLKWNRPSPALRGARRPDRLLALPGRRQQLVERRVGTQFSQERIRKQIGVRAIVPLHRTLQQTESNLVLATVPENGSLVIQELGIGLDRQADDCLMGDVVQFQCRPVQQASLPQVTVIARSGWHLLDGLPRLRDFAFPQKDGGRYPRGPFRAGVEANKIRGTVGLA